MAEGGEVVDRGRTSIAVDFEQDSEQDGASACRDPLRGERRVSGAGMTSSAEQNGSRTWTRTPMEIADLRAFESQ